MKYVLPLAAAFAAASSVHALVDHDVQKSFPVSPGGTVQVSTFGGWIHLAVADTPTVTVVAHEHIRADSEAQAADILKDLDLTLQADGSDVTAKAEYHGHKPSWFGWFSHNPIWVDFTVTTPRKFAAQVHTSGGDIRVADLEGRLEARTSGGNLLLGHLGGPVNATTSGGNIELAGATGDVRLGTSGGNIRIGPVIGNADLRTSGGNIRVDGVSGALQAHTSGGSIEAAFTAAPRQECSLSTSGGSVRVSVPGTAAFHVDESTSGGNARVEGLTLSRIDTQRGSRIEGDVNGGGPLVELRSSGGDVKVEAASAPPS